MPAPISLPEGLAARPLTPADLDAVFAVEAAQQQHDIGRVDVEPADFQGDWQRPSFDLPAVSLGVLDGEAMVAYAQVTYPGRADVGVAPAYRRRGIGTALAHWLEALAAELGHAETGGVSPEGSDADRLLTKLGYRLRWTSWVLQLPEGARIQERALPEGYALRAATSEDYAAVHTVVEDAFLEWSHRERNTLEDFLAVTVGRPGHEPWMLRVVTDASGEVVGTAMLVMAGDPVEEGYVERLAVRRDQRGQGLAQALLVDAFEQGRQHGAPRSGLSTDSRTGALSLYEKVGMVVTDTWVNRGLPLVEEVAQRPSRDPVS